MKHIKDLSKEELLGLIYHEIPHTVIDDHLCMCATCDNMDEVDDAHVGSLLIYVCDGCINGI